MIQVRGRTDRQYLPRQILPEDKHAKLFQPFQLNAVVPFDAWAARVIDLGKSNKSFYFPDRAFDYEVKVSDKEDGSLANGKIKPEQVSVNIDYLAEGYDKIAIAQGHRSAEASASFAKGMKLIAANDCKACHSNDKKSIGPAYNDVASKYKGKASAVELLTKKVISGGSGVWGEVPMAGHPQLSAADASEMVKYILSLADQKAKIKSLPIKGEYTTKLKPGDKGNGVYILRASYRDNGANGLPALTSEETFTLHNPSLSPHKFDDFSFVNKMSFGGIELVIPTQSGSYFRLNQTDLTGIKQIELMAMAPKAQLNAAGGTVELRIDSPTGQVIGATDFIGDIPGAGFSAKPSTLPINPTEGRHDIFLVFQNPNAPSGQSLMVVTNVEFKTDAPANVLSALSMDVKVDLKDYSGKYNMTGLPFPFIEVCVKEGKLIMDAGGSIGEITPTDTPDKYDAGGKAIIYFVRDDAQKVVNMKMEAMGFTFEGKKE